DVHNAFEIIETYEKSHQFFSFFKDVRNEEHGDEGSNCFEKCTIKEEELNEDLNETQSNFGTDESKGSEPDLGNMIDGFKGFDDAHNAFEIIGTYERSHQFFSFFKDVREEECDDAGSNCSEEATNNGTQNASSGRK
ncbi:hypothetical protein M5D96_005552, partial [Drosophila gunungcola]